MNSKLELNLELELDIKNLKSMLNKYTTMLQEAQVNYSKSKKVFKERLGFIFFQFKNVYVKDDWWY